jgi:hypothetical protein
MNRFAGAREAKEFIVARIVAEAQIEGISLSEVERKELYFSKTDWTLPDMMEVNAAFDRDYDPDEYERKIAGVIRNARERARKEDRQDYEAWSDAIRVLSQEDHYVLLMVGHAGAGQAGVSTRPPGDLLKLWLTGLLIVCLLIAAMPFLPRLEEKLGRDALGAYASGIALCLAVAYALLRFVVGVKTVDKFADKVLGKLFKPFGGAK